MKLKGEYRPLAFPFSMIYLEKCEVRGAYTMAKSENQKVKTLFLSFAKQRFSAKYGYNFLFLLGEML